MRALALLVPVALLAASPAVVASDDVHSRNVAFLASLLRDADPAQPASLPGGRVVTLAEAIDAAAARAGSVDLAALANGAAPSGNKDYVGTLWVLEIGQGECAVTALGPGSGSPVAVDPQTQTSGGGFGSLETSHGYYTMVTDWSTKVTETYFGTGGFTFVGEQDFFCFSFALDHVAFPFGFGGVRIH